MTILKTPREIEVMAEGGRRLAEILAALVKEAQPGVSTMFLDTLAAELIGEAGARPAFLNYKPRGAKTAYPYTICASINEVIVHAPPSEYLLREGDVFKLDLGLVYKKFYVDTATTIAVGNVGKVGERLIAATREALEAAIHAAHPGNTLGDIGFAVQSTVLKHNFSVAKLLTGHGIGRELHEDPSVLNTGRPGEGEVLEPGQVFAIEPMVAVGGGELVHLPDDSFAAKDGSLTAHFEHTVAITPQGPRVLTQL